MKKKKLAFLCQKGLETFIEPIIREFEKFPEYQVRRYYISTQQEIIAAIKWADKVFIEWANEVAILATQIYDLKKKGCVVRLHSYESLTPMPGRIDWSFVDYLVFVAPHIRKIVKSKIPDIENKVLTKIVPNGVNLDKIGQNTVLNPHEIAYVCSLNNRKGNPASLQIMAELVKINPAYRLHVAGAFQEEHLEIYMKHMAREMGIEDNIIYYGHVTDMNAFWEGKGIILSTSIHEGHPVNVIEGMARGLQPVIHNFNGAKGLYPPDLIYNTVNEAVNLISDPKKTHKSEYINYVIDRGWTIENQIKQLKALVDKAGTKGKK